MSNSYTDHLLYPSVGSNRANPAYKSGEVNQLNKDCQPQNISGDAAIAESWEMSNARVRDLIRNDPMLSKSLTMMSALVIGAGVHSYAEATDANGTYLEKFCETSDDLWEEWALEEADATGRMTFWEMHELSFKEMATTGFCMWMEVMRNEPGRQTPLCYQLLETEQIDRTKDQPAARGQNAIRNGIEFDRYNRAIAVHLYDEHPYEYGWYGASTLSSKRIPIRRLLLNYRPDRISAHIGATWYNCLVQTSRDSDRLIANELTSRAVKALMTLFVKRQNPGTCIADGLNAEDVTTQKSPIKMGYPAIIEIGKDEDIEVAESKNKSGEDAASFFNLLLGQFAMGSKLSRHRLTGNAQEANLASIRAGHLDDERVVQPIQNHQIDHIARPIRKRHQSLGVGLGHYGDVMSAANFVANRRRYSKMFIVSAADPDFQPKEDGEASIDRMRSGRTTPQYEIARTGQYWRRNIRQIKQYFDALKAAGLGNPDWTKGAGGTYLPFVPMEDQPVMQQAKGGSDGETKPKPKQEPAK